MKKIMAVVLAAVTTMTMMTACAASIDDSETNETVEITVNYSYGLTEDGYYEGVNLSDYVTLPDNYKSIIVTAEDVNQTEEEWISYYNNVLTSAGTKTELADAVAEDGSFVTIDFKGTVDEKEFTGGSAEAIDLQIGSGEYLPEFDTGIIGHKAGETFDVEVVFPEDYPATTDLEGNEIQLSQKTAIFTITLKSVNEYTLTDENIAQFYEAVNEERENKILTIEDMKNYSQEIYSKTKLQNKVITEVAENSILTEIPQAVLDAYVYVEMKLLKANAASAGLSEEYLVQMNGFESVDEYKQYITENSSQYLETQMILLTIAEKEGLQYDEETCRESFQGEPDELIRMYGKGYVAQNVICQKAINLLIEWADVQ